MPGSSYQISQNFKDEARRIFASHRNPPEFLGGSGMRNPGTGRVINLKRKSDERKWLRTFEREIVKAQNYAEGSSNYKFKLKKTTRNNNRDYSVYNLKFPYRMPVDRVDLNIQKLLEDFFTQNNLDPNSRVRLAGQYVDYEGDPRGVNQWVSESYMTSQDLLSVLATRLLFTGEGSRDYQVQLSELHQLTVSVLQET